MKNGTRPNIHNTPVTMYLDEQNESQLRAKLAELRVAHRELDDTIHKLIEEAYIDQLRLRRMKKEKLHLKDAIAKIESLLIPDLDA